MCNWDIRRKKSEEQEKEMKKEEKREKKGRNSGKGRAIDDKFK